LDYCNNIDSPPAYFIHIYQNGSSQLYENLERSFTLEEIPSVSQDKIFNIVEQSAPSSALDKGKGLYID